MVFEKTITLSVPLPSHGCIIRYGEFNSEGDPSMDRHPIQGEGRGRNTPCHDMLQTPEISTDLTRRLNMSNLIFFFFMEKIPTFRCGIRLTWTEPNNILETDYAQCNN